MLVTMKLRLLCPRDRDTERMIAAIMTMLMMVMAWFSLIGSTCTLQLPEKTGFAKTHDNSTFPRVLFDVVEAATGRLRSLFGLSLE